jgi:hypothetical protein
VRADNGADQRVGNTPSDLPRNDINFAILPELTDQDLKGIGVSSLGHRRQLLSATAELKGVERNAPKSAAAAAAVPSPPDAAERRQVTVMFCDPGPGVMISPWRSVLIFCLARDIDPRVSASRQIT